MGGVSTARPRTSFCTGKSSIFRKWVWVLFLDHGNEPAGAGGVGASEAGIVFDDIGALRQREVTDGLMGIQSETSEGGVSAAQQECAMMLGIDSHAMVVLASATAYLPATV